MEPQRKAQSCCRQPTRRYASSTSKKLSLTAFRQRSSVNRLGSMPSSTLHGSEQGGGQRAAVGYLLQAYDVELAVPRDELMQRFIRPVGGRTALECQ